MKTSNVKEKTYKVTQWSYTWTKIAVISLYILGVLGIWSEAPAYLQMIDGIFNIIISLTLIYFFNPLRKTKCNDFHRKVVFSAGIAIFIQTSLMQYLNPVNLFKKFHKH